MLTLLDYIVYRLIEDHFITETLPMYDIPNNYPTLPGVTMQDRVQQATRKIEVDLTKAGALPVRPHPNADRQPQHFDIGNAAQILKNYASMGAPADFFGHEADPEPWYSFAQWVAAEDKVEPYCDDVFVVDLTACDLRDECGPNGGGHVIIEDHEMLVTLVLYAAPHATDGRALALYQVERIS